MLENAIQNERERIAQTLHGTICQEITAAYFLACGVALRCEKTAPETPAQILELADKMQCAGRDPGKFATSLREDQPPRHD